MTATPRRRSVGTGRRHLASVPATSGAANAGMFAITDPAWRTWPRCDVCTWPVHPAVNSHAACYPHQPDLRSV